MKYVVIAIEDGETEEFIVPDAASPEAAIDEVAARIPGAIVDGDACWLDTLLAVDERLVVHHMLSYVDKLKEVDD